LHPKHEEVAGMSTQDRSSHHTKTTTKPASIAVGVDGSERNDAAVSWAREEAEATGRQLVLVGATGEYTPPIPGFSADYTITSVGDTTRTILKSVRSRLQPQAEEIPILVESGKPSDVLLRAAKAADLLVVGQRGMGAVKRVLVGSTSIAVAGRSPGPVAIVPDNWAQPTKSTAPIVVGVDDTNTDDAVLDFAFSRARRLGVPLIGVYAWELPPIFSWSPTDIELWSQRAREQFDQKLNRWSKRYPTVELVKLVRQTTSANAVLDASEVAQMVVLGRHSGPHHIGGFSLGSTTRGVLHYSVCPVAVVPVRLGRSSGDEPSEEDVPEF
jgi:nucleotide-binding universal stress UspA family protein